MRKPAYPGLLALLQLVLPLASLGADSQGGTQEPAPAASTSSTTPAASAASPSSAVPAGPSLDRNLEIGGLVTLDHHNAFSASEDPALDLGEVALGANVTLSEDILASVLLKAEEELDHIFFDQAMAQVTPHGGAWTFLFGQQTYSHGLLTTRLISDPEILGYLEINRPGICALFSHGEFTAGGSVSLWETGSDESLSRDYAFIPNLDWNRGPVQARLSGMVSRYQSDADAAVTISWGPARLDAEGFLRIPAWDGEEKTGGYLLGLEVDVGNRLAVAYRQDGVSDDRLRALPVVRHGIGASFALKPDLFAAVEYSDGKGGEDSGPRIALQLGLKSTLNLPGFQRATLTQD